MESKKIIGIDLGATNIRGAVISGDEISEIKSHRIKSNGTEEEVLNDVFALLDKLKEETYHSNRHWCAQRCRYRRRYCV